MYSMEAIAGWMLNNIDGVTNKKLQKLMYYAYAWYLVLFNESAEDLQNRLFVAKFEAWVHGPVIPELYQELKTYHSDIIPKNRFDTFKSAEIDPDTEDLLKQIQSVYGKYNGNELESITHQETPWQNARKGCSAYDICNELITDKDMFTYYIQRLNT